MPGKRGYWYAYEWVHRRWHSFSKAMYKLGEIVTPTEFELIHGIQGHDKRIDYMNWRMADICFRAIRNGKVVEDEIELTQFRS